VPDEYAMDAEQQWEFTSVRLLEMFNGWTFDYVDSLTDWQVRKIFAVVSAENKYKEQQANKAKNRS
jgi:hypothetical protein